MGKIIFKHGDLFETSCSIISQGVNCSNGFGSGVAGQIARLFPDVKHAYHEKHKLEGWKVGEVQFVVPRSGPESLQYIANMATQKTYGRQAGVCYVDYQGLQKAVATLVDFAVEARLTVAMPKIGAGLGGGDWNRILRIIREAVRDRDVTIEIWSLE